MIRKIQKATVMTMKLYEVNEAIAEIDDKIINPETGEVSENADELMKKLDSLQMERKKILEYLAKLVLNAKAEESAMKAEEQRLKARRERTVKKKESLMEVLDRECKGRKTYLGVATLCYGKSTRVDVSDSEKAVEWLKENNHPDCYRVPAPEIAKKEVRKLLDAGTEVPGCAVVEDRYCSLR